MAVLYLFRPAAKTATTTIANDSVSGARGGEARLGVVRLPAVVLHVSSDFDAKIRGMLSSLTGFAIGNSEAPGCQWHCETPGCKG